MPDTNRIPVYQDFMLPTLQVLADGIVKNTRDVADAAADILAVPAEDRLITLPSGTLKCRGRGQWAQTYLAQAGLITRPSRGMLTITAAGRELLADPPDRVTTKYLRKYPSFVAFTERRRAGSTSQGQDVVARDEPEESPEELIDQAIEANLAEVQSDLLARVRSLDPYAFERLVLRVLVALGYGTAATAQQTGRSGDEGIDGIVHRDSLGLDRVYMQAKRYTDNAVGPEAINAFYGALQRKGADRGVFITSSTFTKGARQAETDFRNIVLIDGDELVRLMAERGVGVEVTSTYVLKRINEDYFETL